MKKTLIINDTHLGVKRQAGTTKESREALEEWMLLEFRKLLDIPHDRLIILGDLFDKRNVEEHIMLKVIELLRLEEDCSIVAGNHDLGGREDHTMSSAQLVAELANSYWLDEAALVSGRYIIPHLHSQEEFDTAIQLCPYNTVMMVHCNIDSPFAHGDHSLNLSLPQMKDLSDRGVDVIAGHEHTKRNVMNVTILGNQFPSSISDCMGGDKFAHILEGDELEEIETWDASKYFAGPDILTGNYDFINITGECELSEYAAMVKQVATLRKNSKAFIVKNGVKVKEFVAEQGDVEVTDFNIIEMMLEEVPADIRKEVEKCI